VTFWPTLAIRCITMTDNHFHFYIGTGEAETAIQTYVRSSGLVMWRSGNPPTVESLEPAKTQPLALLMSLRSLYGMRVGNSVVYAAVVSGLYHGTHSSLPTDGLFRSTDGGTTWFQFYRTLQVSVFPIPIGCGPWSRRKDRCRYHAQPGWKRTAVLLYSRYRLARIVM